MKQTVEKAMSRQGKRVLFILSALLVTSALVRLGAGPGAAIALELTEEDVALQPPTGRMVDADISPKLVELLTAVKAKEAALQERENQIDARVQALALVESEVSLDIERLEQAEAKLRATISTASEAAETDIVRLTAVYENMKPAQATPLFERMEPSFAAGFLGRMRPDAAAAILAGLTPDLAYSISVVLAGRNADVPTENLGQ